MRSINNKINGYNINGYNSSISDTWFDGWKDLLSNTKSSNIYYPSSTTTTTSVPYPGQTTIDFRGIDFPPSMKDDSEVEGNVIEGIEKLGFTKVGPKNSMVDMRIIGVLKHTTVNLNNYKLFFKSMESRWLSDFMMCINYCTNECLICVSDNFVDIQRDDLMEEVKKIIKEHDLLWYYDAGQ